MKTKPITPKNRLAAAVGVALLGAVAMPASAFQLDLGNPDISARLDTTASLGALWRTQAAQPQFAANTQQNLYNTAPYNDPTNYLYMAAHGYGTQINKNDGENNFDTGLSSLVAKITPELDISYKNNYGAFVRATAFYDNVIMNDGRDNNGSLSDFPNNGSGPDFSQAAKDWAGQRTRMLDSYVWGNFNVFNKPLNVRLGRQVINWGEAVFLQNGVNTANYYDLTALRLPGSEIKEALLPLGDLYFQLGATENLSVEGFYQFEWKNSEDSAAGTYYSQHDAFPGPGANHIIIDDQALAAAQADAAYGSQADPQNPDPNWVTAYHNALMQIQSYNASQGQYQLMVDRIPDQQAKNTGQYGMAFRYFADQLLNGTELAFYYSSTHARIPVVGSQIPLALGNPLAIMDNTKYFMAYPENIDMYGFSFNTTVGTVSLAGEVAYRPKDPIIDEVGDNLIANLANIANMPSQSQTPTVGDITNLCVRASLTGSCLNPNTTLVSGQNYYGFDFAQTVNTSLVSIFNFGQPLGTDGLVALLEVGMEYVDGLPTQDSNGNRLHYASTASQFIQEAMIRNPNHPYKTYMDTVSWGYRAVLKADYNDVFAGVNMSPSLRYAQDVSGNSPLGGNFMEGRQAATLGVTFTYLNNLQVEATTTAFWGAGYSNKLNDRDNASLAVKYSF